VSVTISGLSPESWHVDGAFAWLIIAISLSRRAIKVHQDFSPFKKEQKTDIASSA